MTTPPRRFPILLALFLVISVQHTNAAIPAPPGGPAPNIELNTWPFADTNWFSGSHSSPVAFTNAVSITNNGDNGCILLDTTNIIPAFILYKVVESGGQTNLMTTNGSISVWFHPNWSSTNQGGTGPGNWGNLISLGYAGTNGPWWAWYLSADGCTAYFSIQTNGGTSTNYFSAPVSFIATNWYNLVLTYGPTNCAFYTNGVVVTNGPGVSQANSGFQIFAVGSDTNGFYQAGGMFDDLTTYNYQLDPGFIQGTFGMYSLFYYFGGGFASLVVSAPSTNTVTPTFNAVVGAGYLTGTGPSPTYPTSSNIWITNYSATLLGSNVMNLNFAVAGGSNGIPYDVFATTDLVTPITNGVWYWMGQAYRGTNYSLPVTNLPPANLFLILGKPQDTDQDGLTDAYENLVSHSDPNKADTSGDGMLDGWKVIWGLNPSLNNPAQTSERLNYGYTVTDWLDSVTGVVVGGVNPDAEGNLLQVSQ